eukprot:ctg_875.g508
MCAAGGAHVLVRPRGAHVCAAAGGHALAAVDPFRGHVPSGGVVVAHRSMGAERRVVY